jgi:hypothetical protein
MSKMKMKRVTVRKRSCTDLVREQFAAIETAKAGGLSYNQQWTERYDAGEPVGKNPTTFNEAIKKVRLERAGEDTPISSPSAPSEADTPGTAEASEVSVTDIAAKAPADVIVDSLNAEPTPPATPRVDYTDTRCRSDW